jgi:hypothetical protein
MRRMALFLAESIATSGGTRATTGGKKVETAAATSRDCSAAAVLPRLADVKVTQQTDERRRPLKRRVPAVLPT